jgi:DNA-directed RNA polymerase I and III subunit RPAC1
VADRRPAAPLPLCLPCPLAAQKPESAADMQIAPKTEVEPSMSVWSSELKWVPQGNQEERYKTDPIRTVHEDILIAKLRPGQSIELQALCRKGVASDHAKFQPVATAMYRLLPQIDFVREEEWNSGAEAEELVERYPRVFELREEPASGAGAKGAAKAAKAAKGTKQEPLGKGSAAKAATTKRAVVAHPRNEAFDRDLLRDEKWRQRIIFSKKADHFLCASSWS